MRTRLLQALALGLVWGLIGCRTEVAPPGDPLEGTAGVAPLPDGGGARPSGSGVGSGRASTAEGLDAAFGGSRAAAGGGPVYSGGACGGSCLGAGGQQAWGGPASGGAGRGGVPTGDAGGASESSGSIDSGAPDTSISGNPGTGGSAAGGGPEVGTGGGPEAGTGGGPEAGTGGAGGTAVLPEACSGSVTVDSNQVGKHCGYAFEYWKETGAGSLTVTSGGFSVSWSNVSNLLGRKGLRPGSATQIVDFDADFRPNGNAYLSVYGWMTNPLVEYYIVESWGSWRPPGGTPLGTVSSDGGTYEIYRFDRKDRPMITIAASFEQYWSVRTQKRTSGTITVGNHFRAWAEKGMTIGSLYEVSLSAEGYQSSGTANVTMSMR